MEIRTQTLVANTVTITFSRRSRFGARVALGRVAIGASGRWRWERRR
jgi:hypothetical protein